MAKREKTVARAKRRPLKIKFNAKKAYGRVLATLRLALAESEEARHAAETTLAQYKAAVHLPLAPTPDDPIPYGREYATGRASNDGLLGLNRTSIAGFANEIGQMPEINTSLAADRIYPPGSDAMSGIAPSLRGPLVSLFAPERYVYDSVFARLVDEELASARAHHGNQSSLHEAYAVLLEEVDEFWDEIKAREPNLARTLKELVQVAAMCRRCAEDVLKVGFE